MSTDLIFRYFTSLKVIGGLGDTKLHNIDAWITIYLRRIMDHDLRSTSNNEIKGVSVNMGLLVDMLLHTKRYQGVQKLASVDVI